ncbi:MAG: TolB family protein [bacterium]
MTSIVVAIISGVFGLLIAKIQTEASDGKDETDAAIVYPRGYNPPSRLKEAKNVKTVIVFVLVGGVIGYALGGYVRFPGVSRSNTPMNQAPTATLKIALMPSSSATSSVILGTGTIFRFSLKQKVKDYDRGQYTVAPSPSMTNSPMPSPTSTVSATSIPTYTLTPTPTFTPAPTIVGGGNSGQIAFEAKVNGNFEIYLLDLLEADASPVNLTNNFSDDYDPDWSLDGNKIVFVSHRDGDPEIYVMNADGSGQINITRSASRDYEPAWSPDGEKIVFSTYRFTGNREIAVMNADGGEVRQLTNHPGYDGSPEFIDNNTIVFATSRDDEDPRFCDPCNFEIYSMDINGENLERLTNRASFETQPIVSFDRERIAFHSSYYGSFDIYTMDTNGFNMNKITSGGSMEYAPSWSPDNKWILFVTDRGGETAIYMISANGSSQRKIIALPEADNPVWRP